MLISTFDSYSQCLDKKQLLKAGYFYKTGTGCKIESGQVLQFDVEFCKWQLYRLSICGTGNLDKIELKIFNPVTQTLLYSDTTNSISKLFDFEVNVTTKLTISMTAPLSEINKKGHVSILVGYTSSDSLRRWYAGRIIKIQ